MSLTALWSLLLVVGLIAAETNGQTNNAVSEGGKIVWGELAPDKEYKTTSYKASQGGLDAYYNLAKSFIGVCLAEKLPVDKLQNLMEGKDFVNQAKDLALNSIPGYVVCLVIGIIFIVIFPIVGLCFCCCRCCGNCGGKREQKVAPNARCRRIGFGIAVSILSLFVIAGAGCVFTSSNQVSRSLETVPDTLNNSVSDIGTFFDNVNQSFTRLADDNFQYLTGVVDGYVTNASVHVSGQMVKDVSAIVNLNQPLDNIERLQKQADDKVKHMSSQTTNLDSQRSQAVRDLQKAPCSGCLTAEIAILTNLPIDKMNTSLDDFQTQVSASVSEKLKSDIDKEITATISSSTKNLDVKGKMDPIYKDNIQPMLEKIRDMKTTMSDKAGVFISKLSSGIDTVKPYDSYRWQAGAALASLIVLMALLVLVGVLLGLCGGSVQVKPTERGCASNCGGILLMSAAGLIFIFGPLLMLLTTGMYAIGAPLQRYGCESVQDMKKLESYASLFDKMGFDPRNITVKVVDETITISASTMMDSCKEGKTLYQVLGLKKVIDKGLEKVNDFKNNGLTSGLTFNATALSSSLSNSVNLNAGAAINDLNTTVSTVDSLITSIGQLHYQVDQVIKDAEQKLGVQGQVQSLHNMRSTLKDMNSTATELKSICTDIQANAIGIPPLITKAQTTLSNATVVDSLVTSATEKLQEDVLGFVDSYTIDLQTKMADEVGKCTPLHSIVNAVLVEALCRGIVDPMNGFWLAIGWSIFFFMPSLILSVKLAKYFRRMLYDTSFDSPSRSSSSVPLTTMAPGKNGSPFVPQPGRNKVSPI